MVARSLHSGCQDSARNTTALIGEGARPRRMPVDMPRATGHPWRFKARFRRELVPVIASAPADTPTRAAWLERLFDAHAADQIRRPA